MGNTPAHRIRALHKDLYNLSQTLTRAMQVNLQKKQMTSASLAQRLQSVSPLNTLARGYSITRTTDGQVITGTHQVHPGDSVINKLYQGSLLCRVEQILPE